MKKLVTALSISSLLVVAACGGENADVDENDREQQNMNDNLEYNLDDNEGEAPENNETDDMNDDNDMNG
ncbi:hypothetical protein MM300_10675 [Evansella sp. LMS18]|jgi:hypothetical protein|uniref:hypothetical protein n=1 Tax=Evansella sp. LMS18 TaxID=2924033 RepID=UPI0020D1DDAA|nr:hypothetical protein [Evansella sp. LMS18]UTR12699.1 hypothetical protein MM300_10675 [Evansella sp. LMS18]